MQFKHSPKNRFAHNAPSIQRTVNAFFKSAPKARPVGTNSGARKQETSK